MSRQVPGCYLTLVAGIIHSTAAPERGAHDAIQRGESNSCNRSDPLSAPSHLQSAKKPLPTILVATCFHQKGNPEVFQSPFQSDAMPEACEATKSFAMKAFFGPRRGGLHAHIGVDLFVKFPQTPYYQPSWLCHMTDSKHETCRCARASFASAKTHEDSPSLASPPASLLRDAKLSGSPRFWTRTPPPVHSAAAGEREHGEAEQNHGASRSEVQVGLGSIRWFCLGLADDSDVVVTSLLCQHGERTRKGKLDLHSCREIN